jgi:integrase
MAQHGQVLKLRACRADGKAVWAYRYRVNGGRSKRPQVGGFATRADAQRALRRDLERLRPGREMTLAELVDEYLRVHQAAPATIEKLRWLLAKATVAFGACVNLHNFRVRHWRLAQIAAGIEPIRQPYDLRHTYATFALRAGISIFDLSRFVGASLAMIDKHYGHLARDGREQAVTLLDAYTRETAAWTPNGRRPRQRKPARRQRTRRH